MDRRRRSFDMEPMPTDKRGDEEFDFENEDDFDRHRRKPQLGYMIKRG